MKYKLDNAIEVFQKNSFTQETKDTSMLSEDIDINSLTPTQRKIFVILKNPNNRNKKFNEIVEMTNINARTVKSAINDYRFIYAVKKSNLFNYYDELKKYDYEEEKIKYAEFDIENYDTSWMTANQKKIFEIINIPQNRLKPKKEIFEMIGVCYSSGYSATNEPRFKILYKTLYYQVIDYPWMSYKQRRLWEFYKKVENRELLPSQINKVLGVDTDWHKCMKDLRFKKIIESIGVKTSFINAPAIPHNEVEYIVNPKEREKFFKDDIWDLRYVYLNYPRHRSPNNYIIRFEKIVNIKIREVVKRYFKVMHSSWKPRTMVTNVSLIINFIDVLTKLFPEVDSFKNLQREKHIEPILSGLTSSKDHRYRLIIAVNQMFEFMYFNKWQDAPKSLHLFIVHDKPKGVSNTNNPKPIPPYIMLQLDSFIEDTVLPLLESGQDTPILKPEEWDMVIIQRHTGRRFEDIAHLIDDDSDIRCLQYDSDNDPFLYVDHRIAKIEKDLSVPLAHLNNYSMWGNVVKNAIVRQQSRTNGIPPASDGYFYLFRKYIINNKVSYEDKIVEVPSYGTYNKIALKKLSRGIPLHDIDGQIYNISSHQYRHTVATEMIEAGVNILAVRDFLGHSSLAMTERYIKVYKEKIKKEFVEKLSRTDALEIKNNLPKDEFLYSSKWIKNKIIAVFEQGDGCCEHPYKMPSCAHMACKTCIKRKVHPRHLEAAKDTLDSFTTHRDNAKSFGLSEKAEEFNEVVRFYTKAIEIISTGEIFDASKHFYVKGIQ